MLEQLDEMAALEQALKQANSAVDEADQALLEETKKVVNRREIIDAIGSETVEAIGSEANSVRLDPVRQDDYIQEFKFQIAKTKQYFCEFGENDGTEKISGTVTELVYELVCKNGSTAVDSFCDCREILRMSSVDERRIFTQYEGDTTKFQAYFWTVVVPVITCIFLFPMLILLVIRLIRQHKVKTT